MYGVISDSRQVVCDAIRPTLDILPDPDVYVERRNENHSYVSVFITRTGQKICIWYSQEHSCAHVTRAARCQPSRAGLAVITSMSVPVAYFSTMMRCMRASVGSSAYWELLIYMELYNTSNAGSFFLHYRLTHGCNTNVYVRTATNLYIRICIWCRTVMVVDASKCVHAPTAVCILSLFDPQKI
jgi:hypothetical protein